MSSINKNHRSAGYKVPSSVSLRDGTVIRVNDCVFLNSISQGDFYQIVRITQFLPSSKRDVKAEVAHFYRKCNTGADWSAKDDPILLYATLSTEDIHTCHIVSKCTVTHLSFIHDMEKYRRLENHFYFSQFYEKVQGQIYDVTPTLHIQNLPNDILTTLQSMFSYVFAEKSEIRKLKEPRRDCAVCKDWCENGNAIKCMLCEEFYHGQCTTPPIATRLSKGFDFQCSRCLAKAEVDFDDPKQIYVSGLRHGKSMDPPSKSTEVGCDAVFLPIELKCTQNHPIRYLGKGISVSQALDPFSSLHVRFTIPLGRDYQISPPSYQNLSSTTRPRASTPPTTLQFGQAYPASRLIAMDPTEPKRLDWLAQLESLTPEELDLNKFGSDERSPHTIFRPDSLRQELEANLLWDRLLADSFSVPSHCLEFGLRAYKEMSLHGLNDEGVVEALKHIVPLDFGYFSHLAPDSNFEEALLKHGFDFDQVAKEFPPMDRGAAIQRFYAWKSEVVRQKERHGSTFSEKPPQLMAMVNPNEEDFEEKEPNASSRRQRRIVPQVIKSCAHCRIKDEARWQQVPTFVTQKSELASIMCVPCAKYLFRHAVPRPLLEPLLVPPKRAPARSSQRAASDDLTDKASEESSKRPRSQRKLTKPQETALRSSSVDSFSSDSYYSSDDLSPPPSKRPHLVVLEDSSNSRTRSRKKLPLVSRTASPVSDYGAIDPGNLSCRVCGSAEGSVVHTCSSCKLRVHSNCYPGLEDPVPEKWTCDWCSNAKNKSASQSPRCVACVKVGSEFKNQMGSMCIKPTAGNNWVHLICLAFIDPLLLDTDGKITGIAEANCLPWNKSCDLCPQSSGFTIQCKLCPNSVHALCAQAADYHLGFKPSPNQDGAMIPWVICSNHSEESMTDFHPLSELDPTMNLTQIGKYFRLNKHKPRVDSKTRAKEPFPFTTLDPLAISMCAPLQGWSYDSRAPVAPISCLECKSTTSPFWWNVFVDPHAPPSRVVETSAGPAHLEASIYDPNHDIRMCHSCYWESKERQGAPVSPAWTVSSPISP